MCRQNVSNYIYIFNAAKTEVLKIEKSDVSTIISCSNMIQKKKSKKILVSTRKSQWGLYNFQLILLVNCDVFVLSETQSDVAWLIPEAYKNRVQSWT